MLVLVFLAGVISAQTTVTGTVTDETGETLPGVSVLVKGTALGTATDLDGRFSISVPEGSETLVVSYIGFESQDVAVSGGNLNVTLEPSVSRLDEVVVTGLASTVKRENLANAVASISAERLVGTTTQPTMDAALYGKFKGVNISANSGAPGGGISIKLRGITSLTASSQPLFIVDGVYIDNSAVAAGLNSVSAAAAGGSASNQDNPSNRVADIDPEDIERIEILKGASAAAIYGSRAGGGVVLITTKNGKPGKPVIEVKHTVGFNTILNRLGTRQWDSEKVETAFGPDEVPIFEAAQAAGNIFDYEDELYGNVGLSATTRVSASGGNEKTQVYTGYTYKNDEGIVANTGYEKVSTRLNIKHELADWLNLGVNANYVTSNADRGFFNNDNSGTTMGINFVTTPSWANLFPDDNGIYPNNPYGTSNFLQTRDQVTNRENVNRFIGGANITARLFSNQKHNVKLIVNGGIDYYGLNTTAIFPRTLQFQKDGNGTDGASIFGTTTNKNTTINGILVYSAYPSDKLSFRTQAGLTQLDFDQNTVLNTATFLIGSQTNLDQAGSIQVDQTRTIQQDKGFFLQEEVNYDDKVIVTLGLRGDKSSNNGDPNELFLYPKASAAVNLHNIIDGIDQDKISNVKLRAAWGQAGQFARFGATYTPLNPIVIGGTTGSIIGTTEGNPTIGPEQQTELEAGIDLGFLNNRLGIDFTFYQKNITDLLLPVQVPTSSGFSFEWQNVADLDNTGIEIGLDVVPVASDDFEWVSSISFWTNSATVSRLNVPAFTTGAFGATLGSYYIQEGSSPTQLVGIGAEEDDVDGDGLVVYGDAEPDFQLTWNNSLRIIDDLEVYFLFHYKGGGDNVNLSTLLSDIFATSPDYDDTDLDPDGMLSNGDYRLSQLGVSAAPFIEDASYLRLREVGAYYTLPLTTDVVKLRLGLSGRNLINIFDYNSYDPEVSNFGANAISSVIEVTPFPSQKSAFFHIQATF